MATSFSNSTPLANFADQYYKWLHANSMPSAQQVRLEDMVSKNEASKTQLLWWRYLRSMQPCPNSGIWEDHINKPTDVGYKALGYSGEDGENKFDLAGQPINVKLNDNDWEKLYVYFRDNFRKIHASRSSVPGKDKLFVLDWMDKYYNSSGTDKTKPFQPIKPEDIYKKEALNALIKIGKFVDESDKNKNAFNVALRSSYGNFKVDVPDSFYTDLLNPGEAGTEFFDKAEDALQMLSQNIDNAANPTPKEIDLATINAFRNGRKPEPVDEKEDIKYIKENWSVLMSELYEKDQRVGAFDNSEPDLKAAIAAAKDNIDYKGDKFNQIVAKSDDKRGIREHIDKAWNDYREGTWDKFGNRHHRHSYSNPAAKAVVDGIYKLEIKPQDGLGKIVEKQEDIWNYVEANSSGSIPNWKWGKELLEEFSKDQGLKKSFASALKNGRQMHHLVEIIIKRAATEDKLEAAKILLEVLSVMQYGPFTSNVREKLFGEKSNWGFFGDMPSAKGTPLAFMGRIVDRVVKFGARATFEGLNYLWRTYHRTGLKFGEKESHNEFLMKIADRYNEIKGKNESPEELQKIIDTWEQKEPELKIKKETAEQEMKAARDAFKSDQGDKSPTYFQNKKKNIDKRISNLESDKSKAEAEIKKLKEENPNLSDNYDLNAARADHRTAVNNKRQLETERQRLEQEKQRLEADKSWMGQNLLVRASPMTVNIEQAAQVQKAEWDKLTKKIEAIDNNIKTNFQSKTAKDAEISKKEKKVTQTKTIKDVFERPDTLKSEIENIKNNDLKNIEAVFESDSYKEYDKKREAHEKADFDLKFAKNEIDARKEILKNKAEPAKKEKLNIVSELTYYWDFLQSGMSDSQNPFRHQSRIRAEFKQASSEVDAKGKPLSELDLLRQNWMIGQGWQQAA